MAPRIGGTKLSGREAAKMQKAAQRALTATEDAFEGRRIACDERDSLLRALLRVSGFDRKAFVRKADFQKMERLDQYLSALLT